MRPFRFPNRQSSRVNDLASTTGSLASLNLTSLVETTDNSDGLGPGVDWTGTLVLPFGSILAPCESLYESYCGESRHIGRSKTVAERKSNGKTANPTTLGQEAFSDRKERSGLAELMCSAGEQGGEHALSEMGDQT